MFENLTTFQRETGKIPSNVDLAADLSIRYSKLLGEMTPKALDNDLIDKANDLMTEMNTPQWLFANDHRRPGIKQVKIAEGVYVIQRMLKTPGGLIRVSAVNQDGKLKDVHISGDFFFFPASDLVDLEKTLIEAPANAISITEIVESFYCKHEIESPGVKPSDFGQVIAG